jgi:N-acetylneuraminate synthase/sialic acid synthase
MKKRRRREDVDRLWLNGRFNVTPSSTRMLRIGDHVISDEGDCFVIAEIGHNHQGSIETAKRMFRVAEYCGADAVKLQKRDNRSLFTDELFNKPYENENSFGMTYGAHREALEFGRDEYLELQDYAHDLGLEFFATAFDRPSVDFLEAIDVPAYKVASADICNVPLLRHLAGTGKPVILSTGGATPAQVKRAYNILRDGTPDVAILQCTAGYPAAWDELDLRVIETFRELFPQAVVGLSSHDNGISMPLAAYMLGARVVEKHFTLDRTMRGSDHKFSLEPQGLQKLVRDLRRARLALGDGRKKAYDSETQPLVKMAKKLVAADDLPAGHELTADDIAVKSPGDGVSPAEFDRFVGARLTQPVSRDEALSFEIVEGAGSAEPVDEMPAEPEVIPDEQGERSIADSVLSG